MFVFGGVDKRQALVMGYGTYAFLIPAGRWN